MRRFPEHQDLKPVKQNAENIGLTLKPLIL
jgi:hypothetical protein